MGIRHPAYHLRTNKAVDRLLLTEILLHLGMDKAENSYYSLAGPFLEDLRVMEHYLPHIKLYSIEKDQQTYLRQSYHVFNSKINLIKSTVNEFLTRIYTPGVLDVIWLDYTNLKYSNLEEFEHALKIVPPGSIVRITLRAHPQANLDFLSGILSPDELVALETKLDEEFQKEFETVLPVDYHGSFLGMADYATLVQSMVKMVASRALDTSGSNVDFLPIQSTRYMDSVQMVSVTGIVYPRDKRISTLHRLAGVRFPAFQWEKPNFLNIPELSVKERLKLEKLLPINESQNAGDILNTELCYLIDENEAQSKEQLSHYADYYRDYPNFIKVYL
jgi:hypothetical protein